MNDLSNYIVQIFLVPLGAFIIPIIWDFASIPIRFLRELTMKRPIEVTINLDIENLKKEKKKSVISALERATFYCLIIRYGTDEYIKSMANDQEKYDGRLRNKIIAGTKIGNIIKFDIPIHKRIGTQFKLFLDAYNKTDAQIILEEKTYKDIYNLNSASSIYSNNRIFFLAEKYGTTKTIDGIENNMIFPI